MGRLLLGLLLSLALAGAAAAAANLPAAKINALRKGQSTKAQVLQSLGAPLTRNQNPDGRSALLYDYTVPATPPASDPTREIVVVFIFDPKDVLLGVQAYAKKQPGAPAEAISPAQSPRPMSDLREENILLPLPQGFKVGYRARNAQAQITEYVPTSETVDDWSRMITEQIFYQRGKSDPETLPKGMVGAYQAACPGGAGRELGSEPENGYAVATWTFACPRNPSTGKPETMWMKVIAGGDALYAVQYAYRASASPALAAPALDYLKRVTACDSRGPDHPCPK
ncbi:MAG TPA: hypothetical protein VLI41_02025 [Phenylobacterium sp.]|uniref:hypothetical protein n=1 Tax=Phenylobacterium sp. TaxID=1871053 RepID=UPI002B72C328|nr:hypothetical protein [Phenylobacterium sp.]HSV01958.1 hypothetical protein [Phenylobacterium sp.]